MFPRKVLPVESLSWSATTVLAVGILAFLSTRYFRHVFIELLFDDDADVTQWAHALCQW